MRIENNIRELDRKNLILENKYQKLNEIRNKIENDIIQNNFEEKKIYEEKNNLKMRQDMIDTLRMKYLGDITNNIFDYGKYEKNINNNTFNFNSMNQIQFNENENDFLKIKDEEKFDPQFEQINLLE